MHKTLRKKIEPEFNKASKLWQEGKTAEAARIFRRLNQEFPNQPAILGMLGAIHFTKGDYVASLEYYQRVVNLSPKSELASRAYYHSLLRNERYDEALAEATRFVKQNGLTKEYEEIMAELDDAGIFG